MWANENEFHYLWTTIKGDFIAKTELRFSNNSSNPKRKIGWIIKNYLKSETQHINTGTHGGGLTHLQYRKGNGEKTEHIVLSDLLPDVIQIERKENAYIMSTSKFGEELESVQLENMPMNDEVYVGLNVCAHNPEAIEEAIFSNVEIIQKEQIQNKTDTGKWETISSNTEPIARHECSFVAVDNKFYLLGGRGIKPVSIYNTETNIWTEGTEPPVEIHHFQAVSYQSKIYMFGAMTGKYPYEKPLENILIYNPDENEWKIGPEIPKARRRGSAGVIVQNDKAYIISGIVDGHNSIHVPWVDVYDFKTDSWQILADAPRSRDHFHAAYKDGKIYAADGRNSSYATGQTFDLTIPEVDVYDIESNTWITLPEKNNISTMRAGTSAAFLGDNLIIIGGESMPQKEAHKTTEAYNLKSNSWHILKSLNTGRHGSQAIVYKNKIYIVAGSGNRGGKPELSSMEVFQFINN
jgi:N-acetylneuraminic acid mutarotase